MTPQAFIIPARADPDAIERARPTGTGTGDRRCSELLYQQPDAERAPGEPRIWVANHAALETVAEAEVPHKERNWRQEIRDGLWHAFAAGELPDLWTAGDVMNEIGKQIADEALYRGEDNV